MTQQNLKAEINKSPLSGIAVPIAIVLVGALLIFGVSKMLSTGKNHRDLIEEMHSKTFGNRWIAAYELSKYLAASKIPDQDIPWVVENLGSIYKHSQDARTRNFIILALATIKHPASIETISSAINDVDPQVRFNSIVSIGNSSSMPEGFNWSPVIAMLSEPDTGLQQVAIYALSNHKVSEAKDKIESLLASDEQTIRFASALALINYQDEKSFEVIKELFSLGYEGKKEGVLNGAQVEGMKVSAIDVATKSGWLPAMRLIADLAKSDKNVKVSTKGQELELKLKN